MLYFYSVSSIKKYQDDGIFGSSANSFSLLEKFLFFVLLHIIQTGELINFFLFFEKILIYMYYVTVYSAMLLHFVINTRSRNILIFSIIGFIRNKYDEKKNIFFVSFFYFYLLNKQTWCPIWKPRIFLFYLFVKGG